LRLEDDLMRCFAILAHIAVHGAALGMALPASAQDLAPPVRQLIEQLRPEAGATRGIRLPSAQPAATTPATPAAADTTATTAPPGVAAVSLTVTFATGSTRLTPEAERVLDSLGNALGSAQLAPYRFRIEGHTDTVGSRELNQSLSERRAVAVRDHLVQRYGIAPSRLEAVGLGEQQLLIATPDDTAEVRNRRVQILNLGG
jgi:outer membrane protein OmpA-like peptidoglycan-associated protein